VRKKRPSSWRQEGLLTLQDGNDENKKNSSEEKKGNLGGLREGKSGVGRRLFLKIPKKTGGVFERGY